MKPKRVDVTCLVCDEEAVALEIRHDEETGKRTAVEWCINGHIVVIDPEDSPHIVHHVHTMN